MKKIILSLLFVGFGLNLLAQDKPIKGEEYYLKGRIKNEIELSPHCGNMAWATVIEINIIEFSDSAYTFDNVAVIFTCPEFYGNSFFEKGKVYEMQLADQYQAKFGWTIPNEKILKKYPLNSKLWVVDAKKEN